MDVSWFVQVVLEPLSSVLWQKPQQIYEVNYYVGYDWADVVRAEIDWTI